VWIAVAGPGAACVSRRFVFPGAREAVRVLAVNTALAMVRLSVLGEAGSGLMREVR
jgi:nicotinamide mononucleotide (NMN) deamidase PncC